MILDGLFGGFWVGFKNCLMSTQLVEQQQHFLHMIPLVLTFDFDLILGRFWTFWGSKGRFKKIVEQAVAELGKVQPLLRLRQDKPEKLQSKHKL